MYFYNIFYLISYCHISHIVLEGITIQEEFMENSFPKSGCFCIFYCFLQFIQHFKDWGVIQLFVEEMNIFILLRCCLCNMYKVHLSIRRCTPLQTLNKPLEATALVFFPLRHGVYWKFSIGIPWQNKQYMDIIS